METNTFLFSTIPDSATRSTSCRRFSRFIFVAENCRPSRPPSRSYWHPLWKFPTFAFRWDFFGTFFAYAFLTSLEIWKTKNCKLEQDADKCLYSEMYGEQCHNKHHVEIVPKNRATCCYVLFWSLSKNCVKRGLVLQEMCRLTGKEKISTQL